MILFVNDKKVRITKLDQSFDTDRYKYVLNRFDKIQLQYLKGRILVVGASKESIKQFLDTAQDKPLKKLKSITFAVKDVDLIESYIKSQFKIIEAAGGVVEKGDKILLMYRQGCWDLPKGKIDKGEDLIMCAKREIEEETGVLSSVRSKIKSTYHTYIRENKRILKETHWYRMECLDDAEMKPQADEGITELKWVTREEAEALYPETYKSIRYLLKKYFSKTTARTVSKA